MRPALTYKVVMTTWHSRMTNVRRTRTTIAKGLSYEEARALVSRKAAQPWKQEGGEIRRPDYFLAAENAISKSAKSRAKSRGKRFRKL